MEEAILYLIYNPKYKAIKIGISDISGKRFAKHKTNGWMLVAYWHFFERYKAKTIEFLVIETLRKKHGYELREGFMDKADMPQSGYTETFSANKVSKKAIIRMVNKEIKKLYTVPK